MKPLEIAKRSKSKKHICGTNVCPYFLNIILKKQESYCLWRYSCQLTVVQHDCIYNLIIDKSYPLVIRICCTPINIRTPKQTKHVSGTNKLWAVEWQKDEAMTTSPERGRETQRKRGVWKGNMTNFMKLPEVRYEHEGEMHICDLNISKSYRVCTGG